MDISWYQKIDTLFFVEIYLGNILFVYFFKYCVIESLSCAGEFKSFLLGLVEIYFTI